MRVVSVQVGKPRQIEFKGRSALSSIFKNGVSGRTRTDGDHLVGDEQADLEVHGGEYKSIYAYPAEHYPFWEEKLDRKLEFGSFGENLTVEGLLETEVCSGDRFRFGTVVLQATTPRLPCYKLEMRLERDDMVKQFIAAEMPGIYFSILEQGELGSGDHIEPLEMPRPGVDIVELMRLYLGSVEEVETLQRAAELRSIPESWRCRFEKLAGKVAS